MTKKTVVSQVVAAAALFALAAGTLWALGPPHIAGVFLGGMVGGFNRGHDATVAANPPTITNHEGQVERIVVDDPHTGGWSGRASNPKTVVLRVNGRDYDLDGPLRQAATVKPGDKVLVKCTQYDTWPKPSCAFDGVVVEDPAVAKAHGK